LILNFWQFLRGWVVVEATGFSLERFLNMTAYHGIYIWDVTRTGKGVRLCVSAKGFKKLRDSMRKTKTKLKIIEKHGLPFTMFKYRHRKILFGGAVFFILALIALTNFVWRIDVSGNNRVSAEALLEFCREQGMYVGAYKGSFRTREIGTAIRQSFPDVGWVNVFMRGTRATITLTETIPAKTVIDRQTPCHIIAAKDGLITAIVTGSGKPLVKRQDVVKEGEVLVSGVIPLKPGEGGNVSSEVYVHSYAEVWARRFTPVNFSIPLKYLEKEYTGQSVDRREMQLLFAESFTVPRGGSSVPFDSYDKITKRTQPGVSGDYPLPFIWVTHTYNEFIWRDRSRSVQEAKAMAERMLNSRIMREFDFSIDITDKQVKFTETAEELIVEALIVTNERIDTAVPLDAVNLPELLSNPAYFELPDTGEDYPVE
jgi:similar to stage IV sporulation protein